ncbi:protein tyrosine/serine phosphatase [Dysgonomonadaceae bacterium PH5-43]|nr:protein tyrosine/serine phosphatase [Dysgonomonadaceae bacterium PH5-43]
MFNACLTLSFLSIFVSFRLEKRLLMVKQLLWFPFFVSFILLGCTKDNSKIDAVCELMPNGTYLIKWETFPPINGVVRIYESLNPDSFNLSTPIAELDIQKGYKRVLSMPNSSRSYFKLVFNKTHSIIIADRVIRTQGIINFRDMGGYVNKDGKKIKWGKIYRSGSLSTATKKDMRILDRLRIETAIDLRSHRESYNFPNKSHLPHIYNLPLRGDRYDTFFEEVLAQQMKLIDIMTYNESLLNSIVENNSDYFKRMFEVLLEEKNYPLVFYCSLGKDRTAVASVLILAALDIEKNCILDDYLMSNRQINYNSLFKNAEIYPWDVQESITAMIGTHKETIKNTMENLITSYGSIDNYFEKELNLTPKKREKLKAILLE